MRHRRNAPWVAAAALLLLACGDDAADERGAAAPQPEPAAAAPEPERAEEPPPPSGPPKRIFAKRFVVNVRTGPDAEAPRIGYLRAGAVLRATTAEPVGREGCRGGWYELTTGGFVCNGRDVIAFEGERLPEVRSAQPDLEGKLPYQYGYSRTNNVPVYRRLPTDEEAAELEGYRIPGREPAPAERPEAAASAEDAGTEPAAARESEGVAEEPRDAGLPTLDSLMAQNGDSVLVRRMMRGFYVSLDREFRAGRRRYFRTQQNEYIPYHMLAMAGGSDFAGTPLRPDDWEIPVGWILSRRALSYVRRDDGRVRRGPAPGYHHAFRITGQEAIRNTDYVIGDDGHLYRDRDVRQAVFSPRPEGVDEDDKWIDVDLERQTLVAYEGDRPVFVTLVSTGRIRREGVPDLDHRTPTGTFRISAKHLATTMDGDNAFDGPYSIQDVPYVMYYEQAYALHMAFWHDAFGRPKSHGCVNLSPADAKWIFRWSEPALPDGWHGVYPTDAEPGTLLRIHGETPRR